MSEKKTFRPLSEIAREISQTWKSPYFAAKPYINPMRELSSVTVTDSYGYGYDDGKGAGL
jgi:hypothetical protein